MRLLRILIEVEHFRCLDQPFQGFRVYCFVFVCHRNIIITCSSVCQISLGHGISRVRSYSKHSSSHERRGCSICQDLLYLKDCLTNCLFCPRFFDQTQTVLVIVSVSDSLCTLCTQEVASAFIPAFSALSIDLLNLTITIRSSSVNPPHTPKFSGTVSACSKHSVLIGHAVHIFLAALSRAFFSGPRSRSSLKNTVASTPLVLHSALSCQDQLRADGINASLVLKTGSEFTPLC